MSDSQEHEIATYARVQERINDLDYRMRMRVKGESRLVDALNKMSCSPFVAYHINCSYGYFHIAGVSAGGLEKPDVDVILEKSTVSSFGKGDETVLDTTYRNGREISGADIEICDRTFIRDLERAVSASMFIGRRVEMKLYKLAIYEPGGHFDWHMDSTHSDEHHATVLVALNAVWKGGDFIFRRNDVETRTSMKPKVRKDPYHGKSRVLPVVGFYTDTEHEVEPVTEGVRIVLQYDVEVAGYAKDEKTDSVEVEEDEDGGEEDEDDEEPEAENILDDLYSTCLQRDQGQVTLFLRTSHRLRKSSTPSNHSSSQERRRSRSRCSICTENQASSPNS
jgi:hypothetical protein